MAAEVPRNEGISSREHVIALLSPDLAIPHDADPDQIREVIRLFVSRVIVTRTERTVKGNREKTVTVEFYPI